MLALGNNTNNYAGGLYLNSSAATVPNGITLYNGLAAPLMFGTASAERMRIDSSGNVGIGTTSPSYTLDVWGNPGFNNGEIRVRNTSATSGTYWSIGPDPSNAMIVYNQSNTGVYMVNGGTSWTANSDARLKRNIATYNVLSRLTDYRAVSFDWKSSGRHEVGVIAQELYHAFPEVVTKGDDDSNRIVTMGGKGAWGVSYDRLGALSLEGLKELKSLFDTDHDVLAKLKADNDNEATQIKVLTARLDAQSREIEQLKASRRSP